MSSTNDNHYNTKFRILEIIGNAVVGGMERQARALIEQLHPARYEITCLCPYESVYTQSLRQLGCRVLITPIKDDPPWRSVQMGAAHVQELGIDLIHAHLPNAHVLAGMIGGLTQTPVVATIHGMHLTPLDIGVAHTANTHLLCVCQAAYSQALAVGRPASGISLIPNGVDTRIFHPESDGINFRDAWNIPHGVPLVGFVGRLDFEKAPDKFVLVAQRIHQSRPEVHFAMVGTGALYDQLTRMIENAKLESVMHLTGVVQNTQYVYPALDVVVQPSRAEGMPLALLEAMACGRAIVAMNVGGVPELVESSTTGLLVEPGDGPGMGSVFAGDWEGIAHAVLYLLDRPDARQQMGVAARARMEQQFSLECSAAKTGDLFKALISLHRELTERARVN